jgi:hypothetical protein
MDRDELYNTVKNRLDGVRGDTFFLAYVGNRTIERATLLYLGAILAGSSDPV